MRRVCRSSRTILNRRFFQPLCALPRGVCSASGACTYARRTVSSAADCAAGVRADFYGFGHGGGQSGPFLGGAAGKRRYDGGGARGGVCEAAKELARRGVEVRFAQPAGRTGAWTRTTCSAKVDADTSLVSVIHVNNETGAVNDVAGLVGGGQEQRIQDARCSTATACRLSGNWTSVLPPDRGFLHDQRA